MTETARTGGEAGDFRRAMTGRRPGGRHGVGRGTIEVAIQRWVPKQLPSEVTSRLPGLWEANSTTAGRATGRRPDCAGPSRAGLYPSTKSLSTRENVSPEDHARGSDRVQNGRPESMLISTGSETVPRVSPRRTRTPATRVTMNPLTSATLAKLWDDFDAREVLLRQIVTDRLASNPPPSVPDHVVATYYFAFRGQTLAKAVEEISYHATSGIKHPPRGSLLEQCSARQAGVDAFDAHRTHRAAPRRVSPEDDATSRRPRHLVRPAAHRRRRGHLRHVREPGCPPGLAPDPRLGPVHLPRPGLRTDRNPNQDGIRPRSAGVRDDPQADGGDHARRRRDGWSRRWPGARC